MLQRQLLALRSLSSCLTRQALSGPWRAERGFATPGDQKEDKASSKEAEQEQDAKMAFIAEQLSALKGSTTVQRQTLGAHVHPLKKWASELAGSWLVSLLHPA